MQLVCQSLFVHIVQVMTHCVKRWKSTTIFPYVIFSGIQSQSAFVCYKYIRPGEHNFVIYIDLVLLHFSERITKLARVYNDPIVMIVTKSVTNK